ncbi:Werner syndrome-like exonuclease [Tanacetum coccineum]
MACLIPHSDDEIQALVQKQIDEYMVHQKAILDLVLQFDNACTTKEDLRKVYEKCNRIPQESRALIDTFLKEGSDKDYELNLSMYRKAAKLEKQMNANSAHVEPSTYNPNPVTIIPGPAGVVQLSNSICVEPSSSTPNLVRIIPGPAGLVQRAKLLKENIFILDSDGALMSTQEYMQKVVEDVGEDADFNSGAWVSATNYMNAFGGTVTGCLGDIDNFLKKEKLEQVIAIVKSCSLDTLEDLNASLKDLSGTVPGTIH